jgi:hypothetical protein
VQIKGHHFHNKLNDTDIANAYVRRTFLKELREKNDLVFADTDDKQQPIKISTKDLGIELPVIVTTSSAPVEQTLTDPNMQQLLSANPGASTQPGGVGAQPTVPGTSRPVSEKVRQFDFIVQFIWKPTPLYLREAHRREEHNREKANDADQTPQVAERTKNS